MCRPFRQMLIALARHQQAYVRAATRRTHQTLSGAVIRDEVRGGETDALLCRCEAFRIEVAEEQASAPRVVADELVAVGCIHDRQTPATVAPERIEQRLK